jgi:hypothetical protein
MATLACDLVISLVLGELCTFYVFDTQKRELSRARFCTFEIIEFNGLMSL